MADGGAIILDSGGKPLRATAQYDAARYTRRTSGWAASSTGPNTEIARDLPTLRNRHRDLARNNPWVRRAIQALVVNTVGQGIRAQWSDQERQARWAQWFESTDCDADGRNTGYGIQQLVFRTVVESGSCIVRRRPRRPDDGLAVPLQLQVLEPDFIDHSKSERTLTGYIFQGVEFNQIGRRVALWMHEEHPGDAAVMRHPSLLSKRYPISELLHIFRVDRPGQVHGVPWGTGAMTRARMLDDYQDAQLERQRLAACYMAFVRDTEGYSAMPGGAPTSLLDKLEPGAIEILPAGKDMLFASPPQPEDDKEFQLSVLRAVAADYGIPYEVMTGDLSEVNFSSARMGWNEFARNIDSWRSLLIEPQLHIPLVKWFLDAEKVAGIEGQDEMPLWTPPARAMVDETREIDPLIKKIRAGLVSLPQAIRQCGYDPLVLVNEQADFMAVLERLKIKLDSVPTHDVKRDKAVPNEAN